MRNRFPMAAMLAAVLCSATLVQADAVDQIKASGNAFAEAMRKGDIQTARKYAVTDERSDKFLDQITRFSHARENLTNAAVAKFGDEGKTIVGQAPAGRAPQFEHDWNKANIEVNGDTATVTPKDADQSSQGPGGRPSRGAARSVKFKKVGGEWKIDMTDLPVADTERSAPILDKMVGVMDEVTGEIKDGKYQNVQQARVAMQQKMIAAFRAARPGGAPGRGGQQGQ